MPILVNLSLDLNTWFSVAPLTSILAYLDPGTGSYFLQILLASMFGGLYALKQSWAVLKIRLFGPEPLPSRPAKLIPQRQSPRDRTKELARPGVHGHPTAKFQ